MFDDDKKRNAMDFEAMDADDDSAFRSDEDGMSTATARIAVDRGVRKKLMEEYDLLEIKNAGRYYKARARSKDGLRFYELMIDKQSGNVHIYDVRKAHR